MIKKVIIIIIFCGLLATGYYFIFFRSKSSSEIDGPTDTTTNKSLRLTQTQSPQSLPTATISTSGDYQLNYLIVRPTDIIELYSNLDEKLTSSEARNKYGCTSLISGGFYDTDNKHLGLFIAQGRVINKAIQSNLFDGFFFIDNSGNSFITSVPSTDLQTLRVALQSGPMLFSSNQPLTLSSNNDQARRIITAISNRGEVVFVSLYTKNNPIAGPALTELPLIIKNLSKNTSLNIVAAINLDGGAHSAFISESINLSELATIGSFFCIKPN